MNLTIATGRIYAAAPEVLRSGSRVVAIPLKVLHTSSSERGCQSSSPASRAGRCCKCSGRSLRSMNRRCGDGLQDAHEYQGTMRQHVSQRNMLAREFVRPKPTEILDKKDFLFVSAGNLDAVPINLRNHFAQQCAPHPKREQVVDHERKRKRLAELDLVVPSKQRGARDTLRSRCSELTQCYKTFNCSR